MDVFLRVLGLQKQQLSYYQIGVQIDDFTVDEHDPVFEEPGIYIIGALAPSGLLDNDRYEVACSLDHIQ
jgi:hypothetical protein